MKLKQQSESGNELSNRIWSQINPNLKKDLSYIC